jgi:NAD(P)-dependent dehydrogenase (short-subunit alcohol dehydrogenase family)
MLRIFVTGSSDGIGQALARSLVAQGHSVTLHARSTARGETAMAAVPGAEGVLIGDLSSIAQTKALATAANKTGVFDAVIHNAGYGFSTHVYKKTEDGLATEFAVNTLAPYILTALMDKPRNLVFMSSGMHKSGDASLKDVGWTSGRRWDGTQAYSDSK